MYQSQLDIQRVFMLTDTSACIIAGSQIKILDLTNPEKPTDFLKSQVCN